MSTATRLALLLLASLLTVASLSAQQPEQPFALHPATTPRTNKVYLDVVVTPKRGKPVSGLQQQDFTLLDNNASVPLTSFRPVGGTEPVSVILLIDAVNATFQQVNYERQQIDRFLKANDGRLAHPMALAILTDKDTQIQQVFTKDGNELSASLDQYTIGLRTITRSTGFYGASDRMQISVRTIQQLAAAEASRPGRKIILWVSPGWPLLSGPGINLDGKQRQQLFGTIIGLSTQLRQARITLYGIDPLGPGQSVNRVFYYEAFLKGVSKPGQIELADLSLQVLATQTGGLALNSNNDVSAMLQQCMDDLDSYYEVSFVPPPAEHNDEYHSIDIRLNRPDLIARTRTGYYSLP